MTRCVQHIGADFRQWGLEPTASRLDDFLGVYLLHLIRFVHR